MAEPSTVVDAVKLLRSGKASEEVASNVELDEMRELYVGTAGTLLAWLRDDDLGEASRDFGTVPDNFRLPYDFKKIDATSTASGFVAIR